jgi:hypothetical protein
MRPMLILAAMVVLVAVATGNGSAMLKSLETGVARGVGFEIAHNIMRGYR